MKKVCLVFESLKTSNGVAKAAVALANLLAESGKYQVDLIPVFKCDPLNNFSFSSGGEVKPVLGFYFKGLAKFLDLIPDRLLYRFIIHRYYDIEIGFQYGLYTKIISASTNKDAKHLAWMHGYDYGLKLRNYYPKFDRVFCVSKANADRLKAELEQLDLFARIDYSYNVIDDEKVRHLGEEQIEATIPYYPLFATVGRFSPEKGYPRLIKVLKRLHGDGFNFSMWFIGDGVELQRCRTMVDEVLGLAEKCTFWGAQVNPHKFTAKADLFICPSYSEGYSNACTEAIMLGVPVLSTLVPGAREIVEDSKAGLVVENGDQELYDGLKSILLSKSMLSDWKKSVSENKYLFSKAYRATRVFKSLETV